MPNGKRRVSSRDIEGVVEYNKSMGTILRLALAVVVGVIVTALLDNYWAGHTVISFFLGVLAFLLVYFGDPISRR